MSATVADPADGKGGTLCRTIAEEGRGESQEPEMKLVGHCAGAYKNINLRDSAQQTRAIAPYTQ